MNVDEKNKKYKILEPFFKKEKKLREIEKETQISYATLKRWVSQYKDLGEKGLLKKTRADKNTFKKVNEDTLSHLKTLYKEYHTLPITKLYDKAKNTLNSCNTMISYPTFFRIINNLDENIKQNSIKSVKKDKVYEYAIIQKAVPIPFFYNKNKIYYLTIFYNKENYKIINFIFEEEKRELIKLFNFIQESIIIEGAYPKNISLDEKIMGVSKNLLRIIFFQTKINFIQEETDENILRFIKYIDTDILKEFNKNKPNNIYEISQFIKKYLFIEENEINQLSDDDKIRLLYFLNKYKRKVYNSGVRVKNNVYNSPSLKEREGTIVDVFYNEFSKEKVEVYSQGKLIDIAKIIK
ncbi:Mu transposase C-terminal domain-containing protein [Cetobacterium somerae]|uniref:Mu transposase C-terminal domain-containing protein n=1 Tax=Cetobacterium sp. NK01 TaxID=2993530 RepID=UPI002116C656|nr:Mu transposase C-terminal domain-containing protein [Cetobacterium sp. NK01]MCQ8211295.1 Mu transposase C-terminal domain-containing protein [Cetobacterium sp. NK01]